MLPGVQSAGDSARERCGEAELCSAAGRRLLCHLTGAPTLLMGLLMHTPLWQTSQGNPMQKAHWPGSALNLS